MKRRWLPLRDTPGLSIPLTEPQALRVMFTYPCLECEGSGIDLVDLEIGSHPQNPCESCGGRGWIPKEGLGLELMPDGEAEALWVPLTMLEDSE